MPRSYRRRNVAAPHGAPEGNATLKNIMKNKERGFSLIPIIILALVLAGGVVFAVNYIVDSEKPLELAKPKATPNQVKSPQEVVEEFYSWYLGYEGNPLSSGAYKESPYLAPSFKEYLDSGYERGADPVLCAQDIPPSFEVGEVSISGGTARVNLRQSFGPSGRIVPVELEKVEGKWLISDVFCSETKDVEEEAGETQTVILYYPNEEKTPEGVTECGLVYGTERELDAGEDLLEAKLNALFAGPTEEEQAEGYTSMFSEETEDILISVEVLEDTAYVNLKDIRNIIPSANASCASQNFIASVEETIKHDRTVEDAIFAINSDPETFYEWMQIGCTEENNFCDPTPFE